jgi:hypothetical protein
MRCVRLRLLLAWICCGCSKRYTDATRPVHALNGLMIEFESIDVGITSDADPTDEQLAELDFIANSVHATSAEGGI